MRAITCATSPTSRASLLGCTWVLSILVSHHTHLYCGLFWIDCNRKLITAGGTTVKGVEELVNEFTEEGIAAGYLACLIAILYFGSVYGLEKLGSGTTWNSAVRGFIADYAYVVSSLLRGLGST